MSEFEFVLTLFSLVLGLALAEIFGGLRAASRAALSASAGKGARGPCVRTLPNLIRSFLSLRRNC